MKTKKKKPGPAITMYHFCAARDVRAIVAEGLTKGVTPTNNLGLLDWPGSEHWHIYLGNIPPAWIVGVQRMEARK